MYLLGSYTEMEFLKFKLLKTWTMLYDNVVYQYVKDCGVEYNTLVSQVKVF